MDVLCSEMLNDHFMMFEKMAAEINVSMVRGFEFCRRELFLEREAGLNSFGYRKCLLGEMRVVLDKVYTVREIDHHFWRVVFLQE